MLYKLANQCYVLLPYISYCTHGELKLQGEVLVAVAIVVGFIVDRAMTEGNAAEDYKTHHVERRIARRDKGSGNACSVPVADTSAVDGGRVLLRVRRVERAGVRYG